MSLTSLIRFDPETRSQLDRLIPSGTRNLRASLVVPRRTRHSPAFVGTAFDYAVRIHLLRCCPNAVDSGWIAEAVIEKQAQFNTRFEARIRAKDKDPARSRLLQLWLDRELRMRKRVNNARVFARKHRRRRNVDDAWMARLARHALRLARLDPLYRAGYLGPDVFQRIEDEAVREVVEMLQILPQEFQRGEPMLLNPSFGEASNRVGGADADLIAGDRLVDIKTNLRSHVDRNVARQMIGYLVLADAAAKAGLGIPVVNEAVVYFARHGSSWRMPAAEVYGHPSYEEIASFLLERSEVVARMAASQHEVAAATLEFRLHGVDWKIVDLDRGRQSAEVAANGRQLVKLRWEGKRVTNAQEIIDAICSKLGLRGFDAFDVRDRLENALRLR